MQIHLGGFGKTLRDHLVEIRGRYGGQIDGTQDQLRRLGVRASAFTDGTIQPILMLLGHQAGCVIDRGGSFEEAKAWLVDEQWPASLNYLPVSVRAQTRRIMQFARGELLLQMTSPEPGEGEAGVQRVLDFFADLLLSMMIEVAPS